MFRELNFVLTFIRDFIVKNDLIAKYSVLSGHYSKAQETGTAGSGEGLKDEIDTVKKQIFEIHASVNFEVWSSPKISILERMVAKDYIGPGAMTALNKILNDSIGNPLKISQAITVFQNSTNELLTRTNQAIATLGLTNFTEDVPADRQLLEISFSDNSLTKNFWYLKDTAAGWSTIIRAVTRLTGDNFETVEILSQTSGSPDWGILISSTKAASGVLIQLVDFAMKLKTIKDTFFKKKAKVEDVGLPNKKTLELAIKDLEVERDDGFKAKLGEFSIKMVNESKGEIKGENKNELNTLTQTALKILENFASSGVKVVDPREIVPVPEADTPTTLGPIYSEDKVLSDEVRVLSEAEKQKFLEAKHEEMVDEMEVSKVQKPTEEIVEVKKGPGRPPKTKPATVVEKKVKIVEKKI
ncbi:MAG: hypothetical protein ABSC49_02720 [Candidatus Microgenomates bacterium]|jgi:hypothetical protein